MSHFYCPNQTKSILATIVKAKTAVTTREVDDSRTETSPPVTNSILRVPQQRYPIFSGVWFVRLLLFAAFSFEPSCLASDVPKSSSTVNVLITTSPNSAIFSCFLSAMNDEDLVPEKTTANREECCKNIGLAWKATQVARNLDTSSWSFDTCLLELASIPSVSAWGNHEMPATAAFSLVVTLSDRETKLHSTRQSVHALYRSDGEILKDVEQPISPYHLSPLRHETHSQQTLIPLNSVSALDPNGGMHRLFHHTTHTVSGISEYFLILVVPQGMFIDVDDPLEATNGMEMVSSQMSPATADAKCSFDLRYFLGPELTASSCHLYAAKVCDIEQPAFVSGQHVLVWKIDVPGSNRSHLLEFATKLHIRYPSPTHDTNHWVDLPRPFLLGVGGSVLHHGNLSLSDWKIEMERVWVAAGNDADHNWVMGVTITSCLFGVILMMRDISRVSMWDDV